MSISIVKNNVLFVKLMSSFDDSCCKYSFINQSAVENDNVSQETLTTFLDDAPTHVTAKVGHSQVDVPSTMPDATLDMFLKRPFPVASVRWLSSQVVGDSLLKLEFPSVYVNLNPVRNKLLNLAFYKPSFKISFRVNGTAMQYGRVVATFIPYLNNLSPSYYNDYRSAFTGQWCQIDANSDQPVDMIVPFTSYYDCMRLTERSPLFSVLLFVSVPLQSASGVANPVEITVYANMEEHNVQGYRFENHSGRLAKTEAQKKTDDGKIVSRSLGSVATVAGGLKGLPLIGSLASQIETGASVAAAALDFFGLDTPPNLSSTNPLQVKYPLPNTSVDNPLTRVLAPIPDVQIDQDFSYVCDVPESLSIVRYAQRPGLLCTNTIDSTMAAGTNFFYQRLNPNYLYTHSINDKFDPTSFYPTPFMYSSRFFHFWRSSFKVYISFVSSQFHACRVRFFYEPYTNTNVDAFPNLIDVSNTINRVIDINGNTEVALQIPYMQQTDWRYRTNPDEKGAGQTDNGVIGMQILNTLTCGTDVVNPIYYQVFIAAGDDLQYGQPDAGNVVYGFKNQSSLMPSSGKEMFASSMRAMMNTQCEMIGDARLHNSSRVSITAEVTSFKHLTSFATILGTCPASSELKDISTAVIFPDGDLRLGTIGPKRNMLMSVMSMFRFWRGGLRVFAVPYDNLTDIKATQYCRYNPNFNAASFFSYNTHDEGITTAVDKMGLSSYVAQSLSLSAMDFIIPYNSTFRCRPMRNESPELGSYYQVANVYFQGTGNVLLFVSGADDFILGFQLPVPKCAMF